MNVVLPLLRGHFSVQALVEDLERTEQGRQPSRVVFIGLARSWVESPWVDPTVVLSSGSSS